MSITSSQETVRSNLATANSSSPVGNEIMSNAMGKDMRTKESVQVTPDQSDITDALEELGMSVAHRGKPDLDKMKARRGAGADLDALSRIAEYLDQLPNMPSDEKYLELTKRLQQFSERMAQLEAGGQGDGLITADDIREMLADFDPDITHQAVALERLFKEAKEAGAPTKLLNALQSLREEMASPENLRNIRAGLASAKEGHRIADRFGADPSAFREGYRELLRESTPRLGPIFDTLRKFSLTENFDSVIESFLKVAGDDLASTGPSSEPVLLGALINELAKLKNLRTVLKSGEDIASKIDRTYPGGIREDCDDSVKPKDGKSNRPTGEEIASRMLHFCGNNLPTFTDADILLRGYECEEPEVPVLVVNLLRILHNALPDAVIPTSQSREQQSRLLMSLSDRVVETEEKAYNG